MTNKVVADKIASEAMATAETGAETKALALLSQRQKQKQFIRIIGPAVFCNVTSAAMMFTARQAATTKSFKNAQERAVFFARIGSGGAFLEFLLNPILGKLSDAYGRRAIIPIGTLSVTVCRFIMFLWPHRRWPYALEQLVTIPLVTSFFTTYRASLSDAFDGQDYAKAAARVGVYAGVAVILGPLIAKTVLARAHPRYVFLISSCLAAWTTAHLLRRFEESLPKEKRQAVDLADMQPLSFLRVMGKSPLLSRLMWVTGLQTFTEGRNVYDVFSIYMQNDLKWNWDQINNFIGMLGVSLVVSGLSVKAMINKLGPRNFTSFCNACNGIGFAAYSHVFPFSLLSRDLCMWVGLVFAIPGGRKRDAVEALIMKRGAEQGLGRGFLSSSLFNWRAVINVCGPLLFGMLYSFGAKRRVPGLVFLCGAAFPLAAEIVLQQIPPTDFRDEL